MTLTIQDQIDKVGKGIYVLDGEEKLRVNDCTALTCKNCNVKRFNSMYMHGPWRYGSSQADSKFYIEAMLQKQVGKIGDTRYTHNRNALPYLNSEERRSPCREDECQSV